MSRKTVNVLTLLEWANKNLKRDDKFATVDFKCGICSMIEIVLHDSGNYEGFMFQDNDDSDCGTLGYYSRSYFYSSKMRKEAVQSHRWPIGRDFVKSEEELIK